MSTQTPRLPCPPPLRAAACAALILVLAPAVLPGGGRRLAAQTGATVTVSVNPNASRHPISTLIYGVDFGDDAQAAAMHWPVRRWGGNAMTRYSWQDDIENHASDWFFYNIPNDNANPAALPFGSSSDQFILAARSAGVDPIMTIPTIGWTPIDRNYRWGFSVAKYGAQQQTECTADGNQPWCNGDAGNGVLSNGAQVIGNDPTDTSRAVGPSFATGWMAHIAAQTGSAGNGGVHLYALDNEPMLWNSTHRDVHPNPTTYDELWQKTQQYAAAIKAQDPAAQVLGPELWGWCAYFYSALDGCQPGTDAAHHGNLAFLDWYLEQAAAYQTAHGVRLVDYLDIHYYPQAGDVTLSDDESPATAALRLRSLKSLYDPTYTDESWIGQPVDLIPRMQTWITSRFPGTKLGISEYNWGNDNGISSALAQAEALAIFGREGVDLAARWEAPAAGSLVEQAFLLYLNYDGHGSKVAGDSIQAVSSNVDQVGAYAVAGPSNRLFLLLFNKDTVAHPAAVTVAGGPHATLDLYQLAGGNPLAAAGTANLTAGAVTLTLPARSATLAVATTPASPGPTHFYTLTPCRIVDTRNPTGPWAGPALAAAATRTFDLAGHCGIPSAARAVSANLTVIAGSQTGDLRAFAADLATPNAIALGFAANQIRAGSVTLGVSQDGNAAIDVLPDVASGAVHFILDVNGYFK